MVFLCTILSMSEEVLIKKLHHNLKLQKLPENLAQSIIQLELGVDWISGPVRDPTDF